MPALKIFLTVTLFFSLLQAKAQLPVCSATNNIIYFQSRDFLDSTIYNLDLSQPNPTPVANTIKLLPGSVGLVVCNNLNGPGPAMTFYTIIDGKYVYYNGTSWVNTNHNAGPGVNAGGGGGFIYNFNGTSVWRYDGTGDATFLMNTLPFGSVADISVDCSGNFYILHNDVPQSLTKYNSSGTVLNVYSLTGAPVFGGGGGIAVFGNDVYYDDISDFGATVSPLLHGTINGTTVNFVPTGISINLAGDLASCPGGTVSSAPVNVTICSNQLPYNWNGQNYTAAGTYSVTLPGSSGCDSIATLNLAVNAVLTGTVDTSICSNQLPFNWNGQNYTTAGTFSVTLTTTGGCDSVVTLNLAVNSVVTSTVNTSICSSQLPYNWNGQNYAAAGTYSVTLTTTAGCDSIVTLNLAVSQSPAMPTVSSPVNYCRFQTAVPLSVTTTGNVLWYTSASGGIGSATAPVPSTTNTGITNYYVSQSAGGCESPRAMITVNVFASPSLGEDKSISICNGASANLASLFTAAGNTINWFLNQLPVADPASVSIAGRYQVIATNPSGCADTAFADLVIQPPVIAFAGNDDSTEKFVPYQLSGSGGLQYEWSPGPPLLNNANIPNPVAILSQNTSFSLIVKDAIGCTGSDTVNIKVFIGPDIYVPSAFTPNGDGINDILRPLGTAIDKLDYFRVFNRYGELIFETRDLSKGWDGKYKGKDQDMDNYMWILKAIDRKKITRIMKGSILLIR